MRILQRVVRVHLDAFDHERYVVRFAVAVEICVHKIANGNGRKVVLKIIMRSEMNLGRGDKTHRHTNTHTQPKPIWQRACTFFTVAVMLSDFPPLASLAWCCALWCGRGPGARG